MQTSRKRNGVMIAAALAAVSITTGTRAGGEVGTDGAPDDSAYWAGFNEGFNGGSNDAMNSNWAAANGNQFAGQSGSQTNFLPNADVAAALSMIQSNPPAAAELLRQAATRGNAEAALHLGVMYFNGEGIARDPREAFLWYSLAAHAGVPMAAQYAADARMMISPQDQAAATQRLQQIAAQRASSQQPANMPIQPANAAGSNPAMNSFAGRNAANPPPAGPSPYDQFAARNPAANAAQGMFQAPPANTPGASTWPTATPAGPMAPTEQATPAAPTGPMPSAAQGASAALPLQDFDAGFFRIQIPQGWRVDTAGTGSSFAYVVRDPANPARQFFALGEVYPLLLTEQAKQEFGQLTAYSMVPVEWRDMPVIGEASPQNFLRNFERIAQTTEVRKAFPQVPTWSNLQIVSAQPQQSLFDQLNTRSEIMRALLAINGQPAEGVFLAAVGNSVMPGHGVAMGFYGITAPAGELALLEPTLRRCLESGQFSQQYVDGSLRNQRAQFEGNQNAYRSLQEAGEIQMRSWEAANRSQDIRSAQWSDTMAGTERLYDPNTGQVMQFNNGFYDNHYDMNRNQYWMNNMQQVPYNEAGYNWLQQPTVDGYQQIR